jgi:hypothetical protein
MESWLHLKKREMFSSLSPQSGEGASSRHRGITEGALADLTDVLGSRYFSSKQGSGSSSGSISSEDPEVAAVVDWAVGTAKSDPDQHCRVMKFEIVSLAIEGFGMLENSDFDS